MNSKDRRKWDFQTSHPQSPFFTSPNFKNSFSFSFEENNDAFSPFFGSRNNGMDDIFSGIFRDIFSPMDAPFGNDISSRKSSFSSSKNTKTIEKPFLVTLEDIYRGAKKVIPISDEITTAQGIRKPIFRSLEVQLLPSWKSGTKITFGPTSKFPKTIRLILAEQSHRYFTRVNNDLYWKCTLTSSQARQGAVISLPLLNGTSIKFQTKGTVINSGSRRIFKGLGMCSKDGQYGDLIVEYVVKR